MKNPLFRRCCYELFIYFEEGRDDAPNVMDVC